MRTHLLDASVLIPILADEHVHHERAMGWVRGVRQLATCPVVEGAWLRFAVRLGARAVEAREILTALGSRADVEFWPDSLSYADAALDRVRGHRQVTDAYLVSLAASRGGVLATLDEGLAREFPETSLLVPSL